MSLIINGMSLPKHSAVNGEKDTAYRCVVLAHPDNTVELVIDTEFASPYDNGHNVQRYPLTEVPTPHGRLIDADYLINVLQDTIDNYPDNSNDGNAVEKLVVNVCKQYIEHCPTVIKAEVK